MMNRIVSVIMIVWLVIGCSNGQDQEGIKKISADELLALQKDGVAVIDIRTPPEVQEGKVPGAKHIQLSANFVKDMVGYAKDQPVILYCRSGNRSGRASKMLLDAGYNLVYDYSGGMNDWNASGRPTE